MSESDRTPSVLFVCVKNGGKSQMAAGLMTKIAGDTCRRTRLAPSPAVVKTAEDILLLLRSSTLQKGEHRIG